MSNGNNQSSAAEIAFDQVVERYQLTEDDATWLMEAFLGPGIVEIGIEYLEHHPEAIAEFLQFASNNCAPRNGPDSHP